MADPPPATRSDRDPNRDQKNHPAEPSPNRQPSPLRRERNARLCWGPERWGGQWGCVIEAEKTAACCAPIGAGKDPSKISPSDFKPFSRNASEARFIFQCCNTVVNYYRNGIKIDTHSSRRRTRFSQTGGHRKCVITF